MAASFLNRYTVMLLDDHDVVRHGMAARLSIEPDLEVIGSFSTSAELFAALARHPADVVVVDFMLGPSEIDGLNLVRALKVRFPQSRPLVVSAHYNPTIAMLTMQAGSRGFAGKMQNMDELIRAIRTVAHGRTYLHAEMANEVPTVSEASNGVSESHASDDSLAKSASLTPREREVLRCYLSGMSVNEIASKFSRSANTISTQKQSAYRKLGVRTDSELFKIQRLLEG